MNGFAPSLQSSISGKLKTSTEWGYVTATEEESLCRPIAFYQRLGQEFAVPQDGAGEV